MWKKSQANLVEAWHAGIAGRSCRCPEPVRQATDAGSAATAGSQAGAHGKQ
jgi:hypothetical protein